MTDNWSDDDIKFGAKFLFWFCLLVVLSGFVGCDATYSEGFRDGHVQKFTSKGLFTKSWEGELAMQGFRNRGNSGVSSLWEFTAVDPVMVARLQQLEPEQPVRIHYREVLLNSWWWYSTKYRVIGVETLHQKKG